MCNHCYLGGFGGESFGQTVFVQDKVRNWVADVLKLSKIAEKQPQATFAALTKSLKCEWQFLQRVVPGCGDLFALLDVVLTLPSFQLSLVVKLLHVSVCCFLCQCDLLGLGFIIRIILLSSVFLPLGMLPRLLFRPFMVSGHLKLIAMRRLLFVHIKIP